MQLSPRATVSRTLAAGAALVLAAVAGTGGLAEAAGASAARSPAGATWSALTPLGSSLTLASVSCPTSRFCAIANDGDAKDDEGTMYTLRGTTLSAPTVISRYDGSPDSVSCPSSRFCVAIDNAGSVYTFNGKQWSKPTEIDDIPPANQTAVSCASSTFCAAIDDSGDVETFNGASWTKSSEIDPGGGGSKAQNCSSNQEGTCSAPAAIACPSSDMCEAVDGTGSVSSFNGSSWSSPADVDAQTPLVSLSCAPATRFCVAIDGNGNALTFNGTSWSPPTQIGGPGLDSVSCASSSFCIAVDDHGNEIGFDGTSWSAPAPVAKSALAAVSCASSSFCLAVTPKSNVVNFGTADAFPQSAIRFLKSTAKVNSRGTGSVPISCPSRGRGCSESLSLTIATGDITVTVASVHVNLRAGEKGSLKLTFTKSRYADLTELLGYRFTVRANSGGIPSAAKLTLILSRAGQ